MFEKRIIFALGSNLGNRQFFLENAIARLKSDLDLTNIKRSQIIENEALLLPGSPPEWDRSFYNLVFSADIDLHIFPAPAILSIIKKIERELGRIERERWAPREIDIDILALGNLKIDLGNHLRIPHPELLNRSFFTHPFREIEPEIFEITKKLLLS